jgi:hypothetical protein
VLVAKYGRFVNTFWLPYVLKQGLSLRHCHEWLSLLAAQAQLLYEGSHYWLMDHIMWLMVSQCYFRQLHVVRCADALCLKPAPHTSAVHAFLSSCAPFCSC